MSVGNAAVNLTVDLTRIFQVLDLADAGIQRWCDSHETGLCKAPADVLYPFVNAEYLMDDEHHRKPLAPLVGHRAIRRYLTVGNRNFDLADDDPFVIRRDSSLGLYRRHGGGIKPGTEDGRYKEFAPVEGGRLGVGIYNVNSHNRPLV